MAALDAETGELIDIDLPYTAISSPYLVADDAHLAFIAGGPTIPDQLVSLDFASRSVDVLRESESVEVDAAYLSVPRAIEFPTERRPHRARASSTRPRTATPWRPRTSVRR